MDTYKNYDTFKNIIALLILLFLFFITSNIESLNNFVLKKNIRLLILCLLIYFIYSKIDLTFLILIIIIFIVFNTNIYNILINKNTYVQYFNDKFDISNIFNNNNKEKENFSNKKKDDVFSKEIDDIEEKINHLKNISNDYDFKPFVSNNKTIINNDKYINTNDNNNVNNIDNNVNTNIVNNIDNNIDNNINENYKNNKEDKDIDRNIIIPFKENIDIIKNKFKEIESNFKNNI
jgi:hypothetical protein